MPWVSTSAYADLLSKAASVDALAAENERLRADVASEREESKDLLNRILEIRQVRPLSEPMPAPRQMITNVPIISPFGALDEESERAARDAWVDDLAQGYVEEKGVDLEAARRMALSEYTQRYQVIT